MQKSLRALVLVLAVVLLVGCGTVCNFVAPIVPPKQDPGGWPKVYGGIQMDGIAMTSIAEIPGGGRGRLVLVVPVCVDLVASALADTLTLPITIYLNELRNPEKPETAKQSSDPVASVDPAQNDGKVGTGNSSTSPLPGPDRPANQNATDVIKLLVCPDSADGALQR